MTVEAFGITIPQSLLLRADEVIQQTMERLMETTSTTRGRVTPWNKDKLLGQVPRLPTAW